MYVTTFTLGFKLLGFVMQYFAYGFKVSPCIPHCMLTVTWEWTLPHLLETGPVYRS